MSSQDQDNSLPHKETHTQLGYIEFIIMNYTTISILSEKMDSFTKNKMGMISSNLPDFVQTFGFQGQNQFIEL